MKIIIRNIQKLKKITNIISKYWNKDTLLLLNGDLGAGKTEFVRQLMEFYNVYNVKSPSFNILNIYNKTYYHFDFYRLINSVNSYDDSYEQCEYLEIIDNNWTIIEWPDFIIQDIMDREIININITIIDNIRFMEINFINYTNDKLLKELKEI